jgi:uncharacterized protein YbjT (DUF2867 family)
MILVTGATGNVGAEVVRALVGRNEQVRAVVRSPETSGVAANIEYVVADLNRPTTLIPALDGVSAVFLLPGYEDMPGLVAEAKRAGVEQLVLLSSGAAADGDRTNAVSRYMIDSEAAVRGSGVAWTILRASGFMSNALRDWSPQLRAGDIVRAPFADARIAAIDPFDIAAVAAAVFCSTGHHEQIYRLTGPEALVPEEQVRILSTALRRALRFEAMSNEDARQEMIQTMPAEYANAFMNYFAEGAYDDSRVLPTVQEITGNAARTFQQWATEHADSFPVRQPSS